MQKIERRFCELRAAKDAPVIEGYAIRWNSLSDDLGGFRERVAPGSITFEDVRALFNHDQNFVLGRLASGTLRLKEDDNGLLMSVDAPDTQWARDLMTSMRREDINQQSFAFRVLPDGQSWVEEGGTLVRTLTKIQIYDVSVVTTPAYPQTDAAVRSITDILSDYQPASGSDPLDYQVQHNLMSKRLGLLGKMAAA